MAAKQSLGDSVFLVRTLEKILNDKETKRSQHAKLKKACEDALKELKDEQKELKAKSSSSPINADKYFLPLELACRCNVSRMVSTSLDCIQKLVAYGLLKGNSVDADNSDKQLIDRIIDTVCGCFVGVHTDEGVQLQIIKALLTILTSKEVSVHGGTVLQSVRCCYNIYLASRNPINQTTAKASLTQIISTLFQNLENEQSLQSMARDRMASSYPTPPPSRSDNQSDISFQSHDQHSSDMGDGEGEVGRVARSPEDDELVSVAAKLVAQVLAKVIVEESLRLPSYDSEITDRTNSPLASSVSIAINGAANDETESLGSTNVSELRDPSPQPLQGSKDNLQFRHVLQKDCFLVFRTLCKLSMKPISDIHDQRSHELRSKLVSLELLHSILENSGPVFRTDEVFVGAIKHHLCVALSKNGVSSVPEVFELSLSIFLALFSSFKAHLKMQIEVFFKEIFLNILETSTSSFRHKWLVLQALTRISSDSQSVVDIFLNYDCDLSLSNIYGRLVNDLSRIGQGRQAVELGATPQQERSIRAKGLECLISILKCLVEWSRELYVDPATTGLNATSLVSGEGSRVSLTASTQRPSNLLSDQKVPAKGGAGIEMTDGGEGGGGGGGILASDIPQQFETLKLRKETMEKGTKLFTDKPKKGIKFLQEKGLLGQSPEDVAQFLFSDDRLDKTAVGDYMGEIDDFNKNVMYAFVDCFDFNGLDFVAALRILLASFRLPGESQKIDRIMEKFAGRYCETNPSLDIFASADTAYVLAFSIIMLATDLHSSQRRHAYNREMTVMAETAQALMEHISDKQSQYTSATHVEHIRPMFKITWTPVLAALSVALRDTDDPEVVSLCLDGFRCAIRISCIFGLNLERDAFIKSLSKFTMLMTSTGITEMKAKNIEVIKTLCTVAYTDGNYLQSSWIDVLQCISQLELVQLIGTGVKTQYLTSGTLGTTTKGGSSSKAGSKGGTSSQSSSGSINAILSGTDAKKIASIQEHVEGTSNQSVVVAVDRIFTGTTRLDGTAIVDFVEALCAVSNEELSSQAHPRMFSLQKIIELAYYNMERIRLEMSRIWKVIGAHFNTVGCLPSEEVSFFVVDSLRQLSMKFVEKKELANFRFQKDFLRPFEYIMKRNDSVTIRDMVVRCVTQIIQTKAQNIVSGWKNIFSVFLLAAGDSDQTIVELSFQTTSSIFESHFEATIDSFQDAIKCLAEFACNASYPDTSMEAIRIIRTCAKHVAERPELFLVDDANTTVGPDRLWVKAWFPIMFELSTIISRCKLDVRTRGLTVMFEIMKTYGYLYQPHWWTDLFNVIFRLFSSTKTPDSVIEKAEWMTTTCNHTLYALMDVFMQYFDTLCSVLLEKILDQLLWCVQQDNEQLARSGTNCLENLVVSVGSRFNEEIWDKVCQCLYNIYKVTVPHDLLSWKQPEEPPGFHSSSLSIDSVHSSHSDAVIINVAPQGPPVVASEGTDKGEASTTPVPPPLVDPPVLQVSRPSTDLTADTVVTETKPLPLEVAAAQSEGTVLSPTKPVAAEPVPSPLSHNRNITPGRSKSPSIASSAKGGDELTPRSSSIKKKKDKDKGGKSRHRKKEDKKTKEDRKGSSQQITDETLSEISVTNPDTDMTMAKSRSQQLSINTPGDYPLFNSLIIKCVVQLELIQTIDNIIFHPTITRQDDQNILQSARVMSTHYPLPLPPYTDEGMFHLLSSQQLFVLLSCLEESHLFARSFNSNESQRVILMKAGFRGRSKPNLLRQETSSLLTAVRILYRMLGDSSRADKYNDIENRLLGLITSALTYFLSLSTDVQQVSWTPVLLLIFTRMLQITSDEFKRHMSICYSLLCELLSIELKYEVRCLLRRVFNRIGQEYRICKEVEKGEELV
uniref:SEC7 domain-containing protein n=1 Tax=Amphimedon queenslandica TaxID=400682 RepID=A0A1X7VGU5_AMPQE